LRLNDRRNTVVSHTPGTGPGEWFPTPPASQTPQLAIVLPWTLEHPAQFRAPGPPTLTSKRWARDYNETKALGRATESARTPEQTDIGLFWTSSGRWQMRGYGPGFTGATR
jgi:hypothetical protein